MDIKFSPFTDFSIGFLNVPHDRSLAWLGIDISVKSDGVKLVFMGINNFFKN
jgi:hypothetical protein